MADSIDHTQRLATELLSSILGILPRASLLAAAGVSSRWRAVATDQREYYRLAVFDFPWLDEEVSPLTFSGLVDIVRDSEALEYPLGIRIEDSGDVSRDSVDEEEARQGGNGAWLSKHLVPLLQRAAPRLVLLHIDVYAPFALIMFGALSTPAPMINNFKLFVSFPEHSGLPSPVPFPSDLFGGHTHLITEMYVGNLDIRPTTTPPFPAVHTLSIRYQQPQKLEDLHNVFPSVRHLKIDAIAHDAPLTAEEFGLFDNLSTLVVGDEDKLSVLEPVFRRYPNMLSLHFKSARAATSRTLLAPFLRCSGPATLAVAEHAARTSMYSTRETQLRAVLNYTDRGLERCIAANVKHSHTFSLLNQVGCAPHLTVLEIDDIWVSHIPRVIGALPALHTLVLVMIASAADAEPAICRCTDAGSCRCFYVKPFDEQDLFPSLRTIRLAAALARTSVRQTELRWLSQAFAPQPGAPLHLELTHGLSLAAGTDADEVAAMFASVTSRLTNFTPPHELQDRARHVRSVLEKIKHDQSFRGLMNFFGDTDRLEYF